MISRILSNIILPVLSIAIIVLTLIAKLSPLYFIAGALGLVVYFIDKRKRAKQMRVQNYSNFEKIIQGIGVLLQLEFLKGYRTIAVSVVALLSTVYMWIDGTLAVDLCNNFNVLCDLATVHIWGKIGSVVSLLKIVLQLDRGDNPVDMATK